MKMGHYPLHARPDRSANKKLKCLSLGMYQLRARYVGLGSLLKNCSRLNQHGFAGVMNHHPGA